jgi:hypothetical protein
MCFDLSYIRNVSIWLDLQLLLETVGVVARGHEAIDCGVQPRGRSRTANLPRPCRTEPARAA